MEEITTYLFSGYARLPQDVSHQAVYKRVSVILEVDDDGLIVGCSATLVTELAREYFGRLLTGRSALHDREQIENIIRHRYRGHSQGALIFALRKVFEAVDQSPLVLGE
jgi:L-alanine-DL-glutamate epimerase-like enolase superfamily enzyme